MVKRDNIVIDGAGYTLQGTKAYPYKGVDLNGRSNVTTKNTTITTFWYGIQLGYSSNNITANSYGIRLWYSSNIKVFHNNFINDFLQVFS